MNEYKVFVALLLVGVIGVLLGDILGTTIERSDIIDHCQKLTAFSRGDKVFTCFLEKEVK